MDVRRSAVAATAATICVVGVAVPATPASAGFGGSGNTYARHSLCAPPADTVGPVVSQVSFGRSSIDLDTGSRVQTVRATASDTSGQGDPSGVSQVVLLIRGNRFDHFAKLARTSGTPASGDWTGRFTVPQTAHAGTYSIEFIDVSDKAGNTQSYPGYGSYSDGPNALKLNPNDNPTFTVTGTPAPPPTRDPAGTLKSFTFGPSSVNTVAAPRDVHVSAQFSGPSPRRVAVEFVTDKRTSANRWIFLDRRLHHAPGRWTATVQVPRWLGNQTMQVYLGVFWGSAFKPSRRNYGPDQLASLGFPSKLAVTSGVDKTKPTLTSLSLSPDPIDSTAGPVHVTVTAHASDVGSGVREIFVEGSIRRGVNGAADGFYPNAGAGIGYLSSNSFRVRLTKTADGSWVGTANIRQCVPSGAYKLYADVRDVAGNYHSYPTRALANANLPSKVQVTSKHGDVEAPYVLSAATYAPNHQIFLNFSEGVANVDPSTLSVYALSPRSTRYQSTMSIANITCAHRGTTTPDCSGGSGLITSAVLTVPGMRAGLSYDVFSNLGQVTTQLADGNGNPMDWNYRATEVKDS